MSMPAPPIKRCAKLALTAYSGARLHALQGQVVESLVLCTRLGDLGCRTNVTGTHGAGSSCASPPARRLSRLPISAEWVAWGGSRQRTGGCGG